MARSYLANNYEDINGIRDSQIDALIVTGAEPRAASLMEEPYWNQLAQLIDWAERHTISTFWSCLAAHAAALRIDGLVRRKLDEKLSGIFQCQKVAEHPLMAGMPPKWQSPHSRHNELPTQLLEALGYKLLSTSVEAGADLFIKQQASLFVFMQGHPEYDPDALLREYRRDVIRFLSGDRNDFPQDPKFYFDNDITLKLAEFRIRALARPTLDMLVDLPVRVPEVMLKHPWNKPAKTIFANWVAYIVARKSQSADAGAAMAQQLSGDEISHRISETHLSEFGRQAGHRPNRAHRL
jgi:homoserine O-succinyltransferase